MAFRKVASQTQYYKLDECEEGQVLVTGVFVGEIAGKFGPQFLFRDGSKRVVLGGGHLKYLLEQEANPGDVVRVTYGGKEKLSSGKFKGKPAHRFELEIEDNGNSEEESTEEEIVKGSNGKSGSGKDVKESPAVKKETKSTENGWLGKGKPVKVSKSPEVEEDDEEEEAPAPVAKAKGRPRKAPVVVEEEEYSGEDIEL